MKKQTNKNKRKKQQKNTCYVIQITPTFSKGRNCTTDVRTWFSILFWYVKKKGQITPNMGKHREELETVPPQELGTVPPLLMGNIYLFTPQKTDRTMG